ATAYHRLREVQKEKLAKYNAMKSQTEMQAAMQVAERWSTTSRINRSSFATTEQGETPINESGRAEILRKLQNIKIKRIEFENATIASAIKFLAEESRRADPGPEPKGVNIVLRLSGQASAGTTPTPGATGTAPAASPDEGGGKRINLILNDVELGRALTFLTQVADLKYIVNDGAVVVYDGIPTNNIQIKTFSVAPGVFRSVEGEKSGGAPPLGAGTGGTGGTSGGGFVPTASPASEKVEVKPIFETFGIQFPAGTSISYNESLGLLVVKHTPEVIDQIETLLLKLNKTPRQVTIETRFLDIRQDDLKELGFHWGFFYKTDSFIGGSGGFPITTPSAGLVFTEPSATRTAVTDLIGSAIDALIASGGTTPTPLMAIANLATNPAFTLTINALDRRGAINLLSAPRVTTLSGENAQILVTREFIYPSHFSDPQVVAGSGGSGAGSTAAAFVGPSPSEFTTREVGVVMNVRPTVGDDDYTVSMTLTPEVVDFEGFITYGGTAQVGGSTPVTFTIPQPLFSKRIVTTSVVVWDGQTVILGGLINEDERKFDDRVPILGDLPVVGRLFQSKGANSTKRNLMIFVTPSIVDPAGNPIHSTDSLIHLPTSATSAVLQQ
ncbi:MAG: type II secretion system protein GspD, partial [Verrucomicrobiae bacterium]|nr:type II secretion system protein GspD [Verrucomicrobiae bacterium]